MTWAERYDEHRCGHPVLAVSVRLVDLTSYRAVCNLCMKYGPSTYAPNAALAAFRLVEKPRRTEFNPVLGMPYGVNKPADIRSTSFVEFKQYMTVEEAQKFKEKLMATVTHNPYWIIVSDEGPADKPRRHSSKSSAETEAQRLTEKHPGREFTVFQAVSSVLTPKAETKKTEYVEPSPYRWGGDYGSKYPRPPFYNPYDPRN